MEIYIMFKRNIILFGFLTLGLVFTGVAFAHTPLCACYENGDGTVTCKGGFADGSSASGVQMRIEDNSGTVLIEGKMDEDSEFTFDKPSGNYKIVFDAEEGHRIEIYGKEVVE